MFPAVVVVGSYVQDLAWRCMNFPRAGETVVGRFALGPGGKGSNQAIAASRAGAATCFVGAVGRDAFAREARRFYRAENTLARLAEKPRHATGTAAILVNQRGENEIVVALGANAALSPRDFDPKLLQRARVVVAQCESNLGTTAHVLRLARRAGVTTVLNPAPMRSDFDPTVLAYTDVLIPNESEFVALLNAGADAGRDRARKSNVNSFGGQRLPLQKNRVITEAKLRSLSADRLHALCRTLGVRTVIVTLGARGCFVSDERGATHITGHRGLNVVDTTGAGDAFVGGFAAGLIKFSGNTLAAAQFANAVAALSVTKAGTAPAMPRAPEIARWLRTQSKRGS